jgi:iron complex outermembrane receptor protein
MKRLMLGSASLLALALYAAPAMAQDAPAPDADSAQSEAEGINEVVVTAERRENTAQRTPLAIAVLSPEQLQQQNVVRAEDLSRTTPSLATANGGGPNTVFFVRGVGNFTVNAYSDSAVAFNYDGVYIGRPTSTSGNFYDLQRVEVLRGPQGTLYGRNATGGAINVIPNRPRLNDFRIDFNGAYGNYDAIQLQTAINVPLGEHGAFRLSGSLSHHDGYQSDGTDDQKEAGVRAQFYTELSDRVNLRIAADYAHQGGNGAGGYYRGRVTPNFQTGQYVFTPSGFSPSQGLHDPASELYESTTFAPQVGRLSEPLNSYPHNDSDYWGMLAELNWRTDAGTLTIIPAYREAHLNYLFTNAGMRGGFTDEDDRQYSTEIRWSGDIGHSVDYLIGAYYFNERVDGNNVQFNQLVLTPFQTFETRTESVAGFGRITFHVNEQLSFTAGARYTSDQKDFNGVSDTYILFCGNPAPPQDFCPTLPMMPLVNNAAELRQFYLSRGIAVTPVPLYVLPGFVPGTPFVLNAQIPINDSIENNKFTYRLAAQYDLTPRNMLYASFETGYHSGGFSFARGLSNYAPETIDAWTIGSKNRFLDNRLQLNVEGFYWKYHNQQYSQFGFDLGTPPATVFLTRNIGNSTIYGVDFEGQFLVTPNTLLGANVQYLHTNYDRFTYVTPNQGLPPNTACGFAPGTQTINGQTVNVWTVDCSGRPAFNSPKWSVSFNAQQTIPLAGGGAFVLQAGTRYRSSAYVQPDFQPWSLAGSSWVSDASITWRTADERYYITAFVNNIENNRRLTFAQYAQATNIQVGNSEPPRTYGIRLGGHF